MPILSTAHYTAFGQITHFYASVEFGIKVTLAGILEIPFVEALAVTEPYSAATIKNVAKALAKSKLKAADAERFCCIVGDWSSHSLLRNQIGHNRWQQGERPNSVRAVGVDIRSGTIKWIVTDESRDWLADELFGEAQKLAEINERIKVFQRDTGLREIIARKDAETSSEIEE